MAAVFTTVSHLRDPYPQPHSPLIPGYGAMVSSARPGLFPLLTREGGRVKRIAQVWKETYWFLVPERVGNQSFTHVHLRFKGRFNWWLCL